MRANDRMLRAEKAEVLAELFRGRIPESFEERDALLQTALYVGRRSGPACALLIAAARRKEFAGDVGGWIEWCFDRTGLQGSHLHHARAAGELLLDLGPDAIKRYRLMELSIDGLYAIARIPRAEAAAFCSHHDLRGKTREEIRALVAEWLGCGEAGSDGSDGRETRRARPEIERLIKLYEKASGSDADSVADAVDWERPAAKRAAESLYAGYARHVLDSESPDMDDVERLERDARAVLDRIAALRQAESGPTALDECVAQRSRATGTTGAASSRRESSCEAGRPTALDECVAAEPRQIQLPQGVAAKSGDRNDSRRLLAQPAPAGSRPAEARQEQLPQPVCDWTSASPSEAERQKRQPQADASDAHAVQRSRTAHSVQAQLGEQVRCMEQSSRGADDDSVQAQLGEGRPCDRMSFEEYLRLTGFGPDAGEDEDEDDWDGADGVG